MEYLNNYSNHHNIQNNIRFNSNVANIEYDESDDCKHPWIITTDDGNEYHSSYLTVATSINRV